MSPYDNLPSDAFWKTAIGERHFWDISGLSRPKHKITPQTLVATAGSCFAQHISRRLRQSGYRFLDAEPPPKWLLAARHSAFGYGLFSARFGNIYTTAQLRQMQQRAAKKFIPNERIWKYGTRYYDPFRPLIEPEGFASEEEALLSQDAHLANVNRLFRKVDVFVFTLGLTEAWRSKADAAVYPTCPGTKAGTFDSAKYEFVNFTYDDVMDDMRAVIRHTTARNPKVRFLLTVSPVPLAATASGQHVLTATTYSKAVLRAAAGQLVTEFDSVDYFPSFEMITAPVFRGTFFDGHKVRSEGVDFVMAAFFKEVCAEQPRLIALNETQDEEEVLCDEQMLASYAT